MIVGIPKEVKDDEYRVAMTPAGVRELVVGRPQRASSKRVRARDRRCPTKSSCAPGPRSSTRRRRLGLLRPGVQGQEPLESEYKLLGARPGQVLFTYLHLAASRPCTDALVAGGNVAIAYETVRLPDNSLPLLAPMSEVAGRMAPLMGTHHLMRPGGGRGVLVCGVPGVRCAKVVILGAGVSGMAAATMAVGMHSDVYVLDRNLERLRQVDHHFRGALETIASSQHAIEEVCLDADIVIGAVLVVGARAPRLVSDELVQRMRVGFGPGRHLGRPGRVLRVDPTDDPLEPHLRGARIDLLLRGQHARGRASHLDARPGQCHLALHPQYRGPRVEGRRAGRSGPGRGGQRGRGAGGVPACGRRPRIALHPDRGAHRGVTLSGE